MSDVELAALTAVVNAERMERATENLKRENAGLAPAYDETIPWPTLTNLTEELERRGII